MNKLPIPENPMEIQEFADLWYEPKNDWDLAYRAGMEKGYEIAKKEFLKLKLNEENT